MENTSYLKQANRIGLFFVLVFVICFAWYFIMPSGQKLHLELFQMSYFGFNAVDVTGFIVGAIQTYIWGYIATGLWYLIRKI